MSYQRTWRPTGRPKGVGLGPSLVGRVFGRLVVSEETSRDESGQRRYLCNCSCGSQATTRGYNLTSGKTQSCGCISREILGNRSRIHGEFDGQRKLGSRRRSPEYQSWENMRQRCADPNAKGYRHYGGRGITVCDRWLHSFPNFLSDMGRKPSRKHTIERNDVNGNYEPSNCRWATMSEQLRNRRPFMVVPKMWREKVAV